MLKLIPKGKSSKKAFAAGAIAALVLLALVLSGYLFAFTVTVRDRLSRHRWQIPSRVFSDAEILFPGERIGKSEFIDMLKMRGYRKCTGPPERPGEFFAGRGRVIVYLRNFAYPDHHFKGFVLTVRFDGVGIKALQRSGASLDLVMLEPVEIAELFGKNKEIRHLISFDQAPKYLVDAILAIEDKRFFHHHGIDWRGIIRAFYQDFRHGKIVQGGSTLTQQLVKNYFLTPERTLSRKVKEGVLSLIIEWLYPKKDILEMYMNEIYMGQRGSAAIHGLGEAARYYFGHDLRDVTLEEAATLAGMIRAPNYTSPLLHPRQAIERRNLVLKEMMKAGRITREAFRRAVGEPIAVCKAGELSEDRLYYVDFLKRQLENLYPRKVLTGRGLRIFTSLHPEIQRAAAQAVCKGLRRLGKERFINRQGASRLQAVMIVIHPKTGAVLALVGGRNYVESPFNRAVDAHRQAGSLFKPFVYLTALDTFTPATVIPDTPVRYKVRGAPWIPRNYDGRYHGKVTVRTALEQSLNAATVNLAVRVGLRKVVYMVRKLGVTSRLEPYPSLALGAFEMTPLELARAFCVFANEGQLPFLLTLRDVMDEEGKVEQQRHVTAKMICSPARAYIITTLLEGVIQHGTARRLKDLGIDFPCAGKTGTTSGYRDSWFVGYTSDLLAIVWIGFDDNRNTHLSGATGAMTVWADFMKRIQNRLNPRPFIKPPGVVTRTVRVDVDWPPEVWWPKAYKEDFLAGTAPPPVPRKEKAGMPAVGEFFREIWKGLKGVFR